MRLHGIEFPGALIEAACRRHRVVRLSVFGSILTEEFGALSDVDMLVWFDPGAEISLLDVGALQDELSRAIGRQVHLTDADTVPGSVLGRLSREARVQYAA